MKRFNDTHTHIAHTLSFGLFLASFSSSLLFFFVFIPSVNALFICPLFLSLFRSMDGMGRIARLVRDEAIEK